MMAANKTQATSTLMLIAALLSACAAPPPTPGGRRAPVEEFDIQRGERAAAAPTSAVSPAAAPASPAATTPVKVATPAAAPVVVPLPVAPKALETTSKIYVVQKGDTLYSIAFLNGVDYREVAELNNLADPTAIKIGQQLRLNVPVTETVAAVAETQAPVAQPLPQPGGIKQQPKVGKLTYSEGALVRADNLQNDKAPTAPAAAKPQAGGDKAASDEEVAAWGMPTAGKLIAGFSESDNRKGVDITGTKGQPVVASASGKVVYSGSGLRGYGKLIIVKHNKTYLSAYAHNDRILVKEGQSVSKGQKIAEMGSSDADQVKLHFEIRKLGKPVDPAKFLPLSKS